MGLKIKYNSTKVDRSKGNGIPPSPGVYLMTIKGVKFRKDRNDLEFVVRMKGGDHKGYGFWDYVSLEPASDWKVDQYLQAVGVDTINKPKGTIDLDDFVNVDVMGRVKHGTYQGDYRPDLAAVLPVPEDYDEDESSEDEEEGDEAEDESEDEEESDEEEEESEDEEDDLDQLGSDADEGDGDAIARLTELADEAVLDPDDYDTWAELAEALGETEEEAEEEEEEEPAKPTKKAAAPKAAASKKKKVEYEDMELDELKAECTKRGLNAKGNKSAIIARLRANDDDPFSE